MSAIMAQCFKDKKQVQVQNPEYIINGNRASVRGKCPICGGKVYKFVAKAAVPASEVAAAEARGKQ